ncbi:MAG: L-seryl-tRNA(Sec) selenium transferase [Chloroflexota bacterium]|jgi:L-seryl-tRNA(Ser) seleniumtransferase
MDDQAVSAPAETMAEKLRQLPSVDRLLSSDQGQGLVMVYGRSMVLDATRQVLESSRSMLLAGSQVMLSEEAILGRVERLLLEQLRPTLRPVINATGVIIHTNLGRALMSQASIDAVVKAAERYSNLEYDLQEGKRGSRSIHAERLLRQLTGAEAAHAVNNNAAAVLLMLSALCKGREVIISRGQLVEIGGGFRVPDVMAESGARLVEVGTTNRTHLRDYVEAITADTAAILVAHHSNFKIIGFTSEPSLSDLATIARERGILLLFDQGSGAVRNTDQYGLTHELTVQEALQAGADLVAFSGDKLLGGPQAGLLCGRESLIQIIKRHPLARAVRADKMCLAALSETLRAHVTERAEQEIPVWRMIAANVGDLLSRATGWQKQLQEAGVQAELRHGQSTVGGGSLPGSVLPTWLVEIHAPNVVLVAQALREHDRPVISRIADDHLILDPRTVLVEEEEWLITSVIDAVTNAGEKEGK